MIKVLSQNVVNQIAAGEVVERPASVLKELMENSLDAGATEIKVYIEEFGTKKIQVIDNGSGIEKADFDKVFLKHATSKISNIKDLDRLDSYGFRGEALASIASVSKVIMNTKHKNDEIGSEVIFENANAQDIKPSSRTIGTDIEVLNLFENIPARKKFLKSKSTENKSLVDTFYKFALSNPHVDLFLSIDGSTKHFPASDIKTRVITILRIESSLLVPLYYDGNTKISGFVVHPKISLKNRNLQYMYVNGRPVSDGTIHKAIVDGYATFLMKNQYPGYVIMLEIPPHQVDVNVHPRKTEVRFANPSEIYSSVRTAVNKNLTTFLRNETLDKLQPRQEESIQEGNTGNVISEIKSGSYESGTPKLDSVTSSYGNGNSSPATTVNNLDFEEFLHSESNTRQNLIKSPRNRYISKSALLFNQEIIRDENIIPDNSLKLDLYNATQLLESYIVTANESSIIIIDQHAASERFFYEKYLKELKLKKVQSKLLLFPVVVSLDVHDLKIIEDNTGLFQEIGFRVESFGDEEIKILEAPDFIKMDHFERVFHKIASDILENTEISNIKDRLYHEIAALLACHTAVRFGDRLEKTEIIQILKNLTTCEDPYNCPHGRPIIQEFTKSDIEKKFKRCGV